MLLLFTGEGREGGDVGGARGAGYNMNEVSIHMGEGVGCVGLLDCMG